MKIKSSLLLTTTMLLTLMAISFTSAAALSIANKYAAGVNYAKKSFGVAGAPIMTPSLTPEQVEAGIQEYFNSIESLNVQRYVNNFAPNGVLEDPVGTPPVQGTSALSAYFAGIIAPFSEIKPKIQEIIVCGNEAAVNWKLKLKTTSGKNITIDGMGTFKFNDGGKLETVREFWDLADFLGQLQN